jgi:hypothetical protein
MRTGLLIFFATMSISLSIAYLSLFDKLKKCNLAITKLFLENEGLKEIVSRDWAFEYIEQSQKTIKEVSEELKSQGFNNYSEKLMELLPENITKD